MLDRPGLLVPSAGAFIMVLSGCGDAVTTAPTGLPPPSSFSSEVPIAWFDLSLVLTRETAGFTPPVAARAFGYEGVALYEAVVPGMSGYSSLAGQLNDLEPLPAAEHGAEYDWPAVANTALAAMARYLFPTASQADRDSIDALEARLNLSRSSEVDGEVFARSVSRGRAVAGAIFIWSLTDGGHEAYARNFPADYVPPVGPGLWVPTGPQQIPLQPYWGACRPCALPAGGNPNLECDPGPHPAYSTEVGSPFHTEALEVYDTVRNVTEAERDIALFWADDPGATATPPGHTISILNQVLGAEQASLALAAEAYAKVGIAVSDAFISCWHTKYQYDLLRPVTYVQANIDADWTPIIGTPPFPECSSGHSVQSGAAFQVMADLFGESYAFTDHTHDARGLAPRSFGSFAQAAEEAAASRLYAGIHFRSAIDRGIIQGRCIGMKVSALAFRVNQ